MLGRPRKNGRTVVVHLQLGQGGKTPGVGRPPMLTHKLHRWQNSFGSALGTTLGFAISSGTTCTFLMRCNLALGCSNWSDSAIGSDIAPQWKTRPKAEGARTCANMATNCGPSSKDLELSCHGVLMFLGPGVTCSNPRTSTNIVNSALHGADAHTWPKGRS